MYQKFFTNTLASKFIKALLYNTPIPYAYKTITDGDYMIEGLCYIYRTSLIRCIRTGTIYNKSTPVMKASQNIKVSSGLRVGSGASMGDYEVIQPFMFGTDYLQITERFKSNYRYYDSETHRHLGEFLRCLRDIYGIDLMPFYNCFDYTSTSKYYLTDDVSTIGYQQGTTAGYKVLTVPIKYNETYTIAMDCDYPVLIRPVLMNRFGMIVNQNYVGALSDYFGSIYTDGDVKKPIQITKLSSMNFLVPKTFSVSNTFDDARTRLEIYNYRNPENKKVINDATITENLKLYQQIDRYLYLLIQIPASLDSTIVVIEGDYSKTQNVASTATITPSTNSNEVNKLLISKLGLLQMNSRATYAFSNRLLEYLLLNVIDYQDEISKNADRVQHYIGLTKSEVDFGYFDLYTRKKLFDLYMADPNTRKIDITGFVDKEMEKFITRGLDV